MKKRLLALAAGFVLATLAEASLQLSRAYADGASATGSGVRATPAAATSSGIPTSL